MPRESSINSTADKAKEQKGGGGPGGGTGGRGESQGTLKRHREEWLPGPLSTPHTAVDVHR